MLHKIIRATKHHLQVQEYVGTIAVSFTICVRGKQKLFSNPKVVNQFILFLDSARQHNHCLVLIYCFMPDHFHLILQGETPLANSYQAIVNFKEKTGLFLYHSHSPYRLQKNFYDHIIRGDLELADQIRYIAENPVRRGLVSHWQKYPFTSCLGIELQTLLELMIS